MSVSYVYTYVCIAYVRVYVCTIRIHVCVSGRRAGTAPLNTCVYHTYVYQEEEPELQDGARPDMSLLERVILTAEPRVTRSLLLLNRPLLLLF